MITFPSASTDDLMVSMRPFCDSIRRDPPLGYAAAMSTAQEPVREANFDSIVGPTHNYAGLSPGNVASSTNSGEVSRPREAALQGLAKMRALAEMGLLQGWLPPGIFIGRPKIA